MDADTEAVPVADCCDGVADSEVTMDADADAEGDTLVVADADADSDGVTDALPLPDGELLSVPLALEV
jgi:hypothetical protein